MPVSSNVRPQSQDTVLHHQSLSHQTLASALAVTFTFVPLVTLYFHVIPLPLASPTETITYVPLVRLEPKQNTELIPPPNKLSNKRIIYSSTIFSKDQPTVYRLPDFPLPTVPEPLELSKSITNIAESGTAAASAPLNLDAQVIRSANLASKSDVRKMAEASGSYIGNQPISDTEKQSRAIARSAKEDCLGPNSGGSLLSVLVIVYMAASSKCK